MPKTKLATSNGYKLATVAIYLLLIAALATYFLPLQSVTLPAIGKQSWSVQDIVKSLPKGAGKGQAGKAQSGRSFDVNFDFMDFVKEITPKQQGTGGPSKVSPEFIFGALIPVALVLAYLFVILSLLLALLKGSALIATSLASVICSAYVLVGTYYLSAAAQKAFSSSVAKVADSPFGIIAKNFVQEVSIQPETGLFVLVGVTALTLVTGFYRRNQA